MQDLEKRDAVADKRVDHVASDLAKAKSEKDSLQDELQLATSQLENTRCELQTKQGQPHFQLMVHRHITWNQSIVCIPSYAQRDASSPAASIFCGYWTLSSCAWLRKPKSDSGVNAEVRHTVLASCIVSGHTFLYRSESRHSICNIKRCD